MTLCSPIQVIALDTRYQTVRVRIDAMSRPLRGPTFVESYSIFHPGTLGCLGLGNKTFLKHLSCLAIVPLSSSIRAPYFEMIAKTTTSPFKSWNMDVGNILRTLLLSTSLALPLFYFKQYVLGLEVLFWVLMWRHYFKEPLDQTTSPHALPSREEFLKDFPEPCLQQQRKDDDEEKLVQLTEQEQQTAQIELSERYCSSCSSKTGMVLSCQHAFCKPCLIEQNTQGLCPTCKTPLWHPTRLPTARIPRWSYKVNLISALTILGSFSVKSFLCWIKSTSASSCLFCSLDFQIGPWGRVLTPLMLSLAGTRVWSEWRRDVGRWDIWPHDARVSPFIASQMFSIAIRLSTDLELIVDGMVRGA